MTDDDLDKLIENLKSDDEDVRSSAAEALGKIGDARAVEPLIDVLGRDSDFGDRTGHKLLEIAVAQALGDLGDARAVEPLIEALRDGGYVVHLLKALRKLGHDHSLWWWNDRRRLGLSPQEITIHSAP